MKANHESFCLLGLGEIEFQDEPTLTFTKSADVSVKILKTIIRL